MIFNAEQAAKYLKMTPDVVRRKAGRVIPGAYIGGRTGWRFIKEDLDDWLRSMYPTVANTAAEEEVCSLNSGKAVKIGTQHSGLGVKLRALVQQTKP